MSEPLFTRLPDRDAIAVAAADRIASLLQQHRARSTAGARISLTGGGVGIATAGELATRTIDWNGVHIYLGDERFVDRTDPERTSTQLHEALLTHISGASFHDWPAPGDPGADTVDAAAAQFAAAEFPSTGAAFDIVVLGMGGEGHFNSVFPHTPQIAPDAPDIMAVHDSPKPPPQRLTFTLPPVVRSAHVIVVAGGAEKAEAVAAASTGAPGAQWPIAAVRGQQSTEFLVDAEAARFL